MTIDSPVRGRDCLVIGSIAPPDERLATALLLCHTLKKEGAGRVTAFLPYLAYARQDKAEPGRSLALHWIGRLLKASGVDRVACVDVHSRRAFDLLPIPLDSLSPAGLFARQIEKLSLQEATLVAPDEGASERCRRVAEALGSSVAAAVFKKRRMPDGRVESTLQGRAGERAVVIDDILDTGATLAACCRRLRDQGTREITLMVTHGLFTGEAWKSLGKLGVKRIYCTDSVPLRAGLRGIRVLPLFPGLDGRAVTDVRASRLPR